MTALERSARRAQQATLLSAVLVCLALLMAAQWILLSVAVEGHRGGQLDLVTSASFASGLCCTGACWLLRHLPGRRGPAPDEGPER